MKGTGTAVQPAGRQPDGDAASDSLRHMWYVARQSFVTGVSVITTGGSVITTGGEMLAHGTTVSTVCLASRNPPLVSLALRTRSTGLAILKRERAFAVNTLASDQAALARHFADPHRPPGLGQLSPDMWRCRTSGGIPLLRGAIAWLECRIEQEIPAGDHEIVVARIVAATLDPGIPLVHFAGALGSDLLP
jgi:flavin reductase (DIM6/NTAB) family NADH-FMN oxidoreductase RutF